MNNYTKEYTERYGNVDFIIKEGYKLPVKVINPKNHAVYTDILHCNNDTYLEARKSSGYYLLTLDGVEFAGPFKYLQHIDNKYRIAMITDNEGKLLDNTGKFIYPDLTIKSYDHSTGKLLIGTKLYTIDTDTSKLVQLKYIDLLRRDVLNELKLTDTYGLDDRIIAVAYVKQELIRLGWKFYPSTHKGNTYSDDYILLQMAEISQDTYTKFLKDVETVIYDTLSLTTPNKELKFRVTENDPHISVRTLTFESEDFKVVDSQHTTLSNIIHFLSIESKLCLS